MAILQTINYDNASNFTFDSDKIEISGSLARLKLQYFPQEDFSEDFSTDAGFTYDSAKAEFVGGQIQQKDQTESTARIGATFTSSTNASWNKAGSVSPTLIGSPSIVSNQLLCEGVHGVGYAGISAAQESFRIKYTPKYSGAPATNINIMSSVPASGNSDKVYFFHSPSGDNFRIALYPSSGSTIYTAQTIGASSINLTEGQTYELLLVVNATAGTVTLYVDGLLHGTLSPGAWSRGAQSLRYWAGAAPSLYTTADAAFEDFVIYTGLYKSAPYTPGYTLPETLYTETTATLPTFTYTGPGILRPAGIPTSTEAGTPRYIIQDRYWDGSFWSISDGSYAQATSKADIIANILSFPTTGATDIIVKVAFGASNTQSSVSQIDFPVEGQEYGTDNPTIRPNTLIQLDGLESLSVVSAAIGSDGLRFVLETKVMVGGPSTYWYWNGSAWAESDGSYAQSSTESEINDNAGSLDLSTGFYGRLVAFLHSDDGTSSPTITQYTLGYNFYITPSTPNECILYGWLREPDGTPLTGSVSVRNLVAFEHTGLLVMRSEVTVETNSEGYWEISVIETETVGKTYDVLISYSDPIADDTTYTVEIPDQDSANLTDLIVS